MAKTLLLDCADWWMAVAVLLLLPAPGPLCHGPLLMVEVEVEIEVEVVVEVKVEIPVGCRSCQQVTRFCKAHRQQTAV